MMTWIFSTLAALISGLIGMVLGGFIATACVTWYRVSSREGQSGFFVVAVALGSGIGGFVLGLITARVVVWNFGPSFGRELLGAFAMVFVVSGVVAWFCRQFDDVPPALDGSELRLEVEFRLPNTLDSEIVPTTIGDWRFTFVSLSGRTRRAYLDGTICSAVARFEVGQWIIPTHVELFTERGHRSVTLALNDATEVISFLLPLPARPDALFEQWSDWMPRQQADGNPWSGERMSCRFRVKKSRGINEVQPH